MTIYAKNSWSLSTTAATSASAIIRKTKSASPYCLTVDFESLENNTVTVRDRDTAKQERIEIDDLTNFLKEFRRRLISPIATSNAKIYFLIRFTLADLSSFL